VHSMAEWSRFMVCVLSNPWNLSNPSNRRVT